MPATRCAGGQAVSLIMKCDRCGRQEISVGFAPPEIRSVSLGFGATHPSHGIEAIDLCADCIKDVQAFMRTTVKRKPPRVVVDNTELKA